MYGIKIIYFLPSFLFFLRPEMSGAFNFSFRGQLCEESAGKESNGLWSDIWSYSYVFKSV